jgi:hypothetical protein
MGDPRAQALCYGERDTMTGNVHKRGNPWYVTVEMPRDPVTGRRRQKTHSGFRTRKEAEAARVRILADMQRGEYVEPSKKTVGQFLDEWPKATRATVRHSTWATNTALIDKHVGPRLGSLLLQQVTPAQLNSFYADLQGSGVLRRSPSCAFTRSFASALGRRALGHGAAQRRRLREPAPPGTACAANVDTRGGAAVPCARARRRPLLRLPHRDHDRDAARRDCRSALAGC